MYISLSTSSALSHMDLRLKIPSLMPIPDLNPLCNSLTSLLILAVILTCMILSSNLVTWLIRLIVLYSVQFCAFGFLGIGMNIDCFISVGIHPVL